MQYEFCITLAFLLVLNNVARRIQKDLAAYVDQSFYSILEVSDDRLGDAVEPIKSYLDDNIFTLSKALLPSTFHRVMLVLWNLVCRTLKANAEKFDMVGKEDQYIFFTRLIKVIPTLQDFFTAEGSGLTLAEMDTKDYKEMLELFNFFITDTDELLGIYYYQMSIAHMDYTGIACLGKLKVRAGYWNGKLCVEVLSATDLTPHDEPLTIFKIFHTKHPSSDPMVEVEFKPRDVFPELKKATTVVKWNNLNPVFEQTFYWKVSLDLCIKPHTMILLTVKDYDLLSKNDFLGQAVIPIHMIPGVSTKPLPQPMNLTLHEVDKHNPVLTVLNSRKWDNRASEFYKEEISRFVTPVIVRKECQNSYKTRH